MLLIGWDSDQNGCGYSPETKDYKFLYWADLPDASMIKSVTDGDAKNIT